MQTVISARLFQKSPKVIIIIWHSSIDETTIAQDLYQGMRGSRNFRQGGGGGPIIKIIIFRGSRGAPTFFPGGGGVGPIAYSLLNPI